MNKFVVTCLCLLTLTANAQTTAKEWVKSGWKKIKVNDYKGAIKDYNKAIFLDSTNSSTYSQRAYAKIMFGKGKESLTDIYNTLFYSKRKSRLDTSEYYVGMDIYMSNLKRWEESWNYGVLAKKYNPDNPYAYCNKGSTERSLYRLNAAKLDYQKAIKIDKKFSCALTSLAQFNLSMGNFQEAIDYATKSIEIDPKKNYTYEVLGEAMLLLGKNDQALEWFNKAVSINPNTIDGYNLRGFAQFKLGNWLEAVSNYDKQKEISDSDYIPTYEYRAEAAKAIAINQKATKDKAFINLFWIRPSGYYNGKDEWEHKVYIKNVPLQLGIIASRSISESEIVLSVHNSPLTKGIGFTKATLSNKANGLGVYQYDYSFQLIAQHGRSKLTATCADTTFHPVTINFIDSPHNVLHLLSIAQSNDGQNNPSPEASDVASSITKQPKTLFDDIKVDVLPNVDNIKEPKSPQLNLKQSETTLLYVSGKLLSNNNDLYLIDNNGQKSTNISKLLDDIQSKTAGRTILLLDIYPSTSEPIENESNIFRTLDEMSKKDSNLYILSSCSVGELTNMDVLAKKGFFVQALKEGIELGEADLDADGVITVNELFDFIIERVPLLSEIKIGSNSKTIAQYPTTFGRKADWGLFIP